MSNSHQKFYQEVGRRIRAARRERKLTQEALAVCISATRTTVTNIEKGRQQILVHTLAEIAQALNVSMQSLLPDLLSCNCHAASIADLLKDQSPETQAWIQQFGIENAKDS